MKINNFEIEKFNQHGFPEGVKSATCPICSNNRKKKKEKCVKINWTTGFANCHHCGETIQLHSFKKNGSNGSNGHVEKYKKPEFRNNTNLSNKLVKWFEKRKISQNTLEFLKIGEGMEWMPKYKKEVNTIQFNYFRNDKLVNIKFRDPKKGFRLSKGAELILYNVDSLRIATEGYIVEGEPDLCSMIECGFLNTVSVPNGANEGASNLIYIDNCQESIKHIEKWYIITDNDDPGKALRNNLAIKLGISKCFIVDFKEKDINEHHVKWGRESVIKILSDPKPFPMELIDERFSDDETNDPKVDFPIEIFPEEVQDLVKLLDYVLNFNKGFTSCALLSALSTLSGNSCIVDAAGYWSTPATFWFAIVSNPGAMKSHPVNFILKPLDEIDKREFEIYEQNQSAYEIDQELTEKTRQNTPKPILKQILVKNATIEAIFRILGDNRNGICCYNDELMGWFNSMGQYKSGSKNSDMEFWLSSINNSSYTINRVSSPPIRLDNININIIGTIQPSEVGKIPKGNGLLQRFLFTDTNKEKKPLSRKKLNYELINNYHTKMRAYHEEVKLKEVEIFKFNNEAEEMYFQTDEYLTKLQNGQESTGTIVDYVGKLKTYLPRFALILQIADYVFGGEAGNYYNEITTKHMEGAQKLVEYFYKTACKTFDENDKIREIQRVAYSGKGETKKETIMRLFDKGYKQTEISKLMEVSKQYVSKVIIENYKK